MDRNFTLHTTINKPKAEVFQAVSDKEYLSQYFVHKTSGSITPGETVVWSWEKWGDHPITVIDVVNNEKIVFTLNSVHWKKSESDSYDVTVTFEFEELNPNKTMVTVSEQGWKTDSDGYKASHENCGGWQHMLMCLKGYLEHGVDLRK
ncbi:MAG: SRPBCC domain-containing protein [Pseudomonadota bacterium]